MATTKHTCGGPAFGRLTDGCPRCEELKNGASAVKAPWFARSTRERAQAARSIAMHDCKVSRCAVVCTFGDW